MQTNPEYLTVRPARNGQGIFTTKPLEKGETVFEVSGKIMTVAEVEEPGVQSSFSANAYRFSSDLYISPLGMIGDFLNHSCDPNAYTKKENDKMFVVALRSIAPGEEITIDYSTIMAPDDDWKIDCNCGSGLCRGTIEKFQNIPKDVQEKYLKMNIVPKYILE